MAIPAIDPASRALVNPVEFATHLIFILLVLACLNRFKLRAN